MSYLDGVCIGFVGEISPVKLFTDSGKLVGLFPDTIHVVIENFIYMKFTNDILPRSRSVNDDGINILILENTLAELVFLGAVEYLLCEFWLN
jgi:hypothetical protein